MPTYHVLLERTDVELPVHYNQSAENPKSALQLIAARHGLSIIRSDSSGKPRISFAAIYESEEAFRRGENPLHTIVSSQSITRLKKEPIRSSLDDKFRRG